MKDVLLRTEDLLASIRELGQRDRVHVETWVSIGVACTLMVVGSVIFWRLKVVLEVAAKELGPAVKARVEDLFAGALLPFLALSGGCFLILVVTVLAMRWTRLNLEREQRQAQLSDLVMRLVGRYQDEHLSRISSWLHDGIGHGLVLQKMDVEYMLQKNLVSKEDGSRLTEQLKSLIGETRNMASVIYPYTLFQLGLAAALTNLIEDFRKMSHLPVELEVGAIDGCCSDEVALLGYRIVQEALTNVAKHARASWVSVKVFFDGEHFRGDVRNNGLSLESETKQTGIGLMVISERAKRLGGKVEAGRDAGGAYQLSFAFPAKAK